MITRHITIEVVVNIPSDDVKEEFHTFSPSCSISKETFLKMIDVIFDSNEYKSTTREPVKMYNEVENG